MLDSPVEPLDNCVSVVLVEDYPVVREGLRLLIENQPNFRVVGVTGSGNEVVKLVLKTRPDIVVFDLMLEGYDGLAIIRDVIAAVPETKILVNSMMSEGTYAERALRAGAVGYIMKSATTDEFHLALKNVSDGRIYLSPRIFVSVFRGALGSGKRDAGGSRLSDRELHIFQLIGAEVPNRDIAKQLSISVKTVEAHRENIKSKLSLQDSKELAQAARDYIESVRSS